jgi:hypothetical protein
MAVTITLYNHTVKKLVNEEFDLSTLKVMLLNATAEAAFSAAHTTLAQVAGASNVNEVSGNGWTTGGIALANAAVSIVTTNDAKLDADDISVTASGGSIGPAEAAVIYDDTGDVPLAFIDFDGTQEAGVGTDFKIIWNASGIITFTY